MKKNVIGPNLLNLPFELLVVIGEFLEIRELLYIRASSRVIYRTLDIAPFYRILFRRVLGFVPRRKYRNWKLQFGQQLRRKFANTFKILQSSRTTRDLVFATNKKRITLINTQAQHIRNRLDAQMDTMIESQHRLIELNERRKRMEESLRHLCQAERLLKTNEGRDGTLFNWVEGVKTLSKKDSDVMHALQ